MPVARYRSIEQMPPPWRDPDDPDNLRRVAMMMAFHLRLIRPSAPGVRRFRSSEEAEENRNDPARQVPARRAPG